LMAAYLGLGRIRSLEDMASGLFLCTLFLQFEELSKRLVPEAVDFVVATIVMLAPHGFKNADDIPGDFPLQDYDLVDLKLRGDSKSLEVGKLEILTALAGTASDEQQLKIDLLNVALTLAEKFAVMYKGLDAFIELYQPIVNIIEKLKVKKLPSELQVGMLSLFVLITFCSQILHRNG
jgi:nucleolar protein 14